MKSAAACVGLSELIAGVTQYREHLDKKSRQIASIERNADRA
jgi:hypothetical protein